MIEFIRLSARFWPWNWINRHSDSEETESAFIEDTASTENNLTTENSKNTLLQIDYVLPIGEKSQFEAGYTGDFQDLTSDFLVTRTPALDFDPSNNNQSSHRIK